MKVRRKTVGICFSIAALIALCTMAEQFCSKDASDPETIVFTAGLSAWTEPGTFVARYRTSAASEPVQIDTSKRVGLRIIVR